MARTRCSAQASVPPPVAGCHADLSLALAPMGASLAEENFFDGVALRSGTSGSDAYEICKAPEPAGWLNGPEPRSSQ